MRTIHVRRHCRVPAEALFAVLADHAGYVRLPGVRSARLTRPGDAERNGTGAIREIDLGAAWFREEIVDFEPPHLLGYRIRQSRPPIEHAFGRIELTPCAGGCDVEWTSRFRVAVPVIGGLLGWIAQRRMSAAFATALAACERIAATPVPALAATGAA